jgi:arylsulfatase A-like enzyme
MPDGVESSKQTRRTFLSTGTRALGGLAIANRAIEAISSESPGARNRPNFVFFLGEGLRADELSSTGNKIISTPHLDRVVQEGMSFQNAFVVNSLCLPSRATILTGLYSHSCGCVDNKDREIPTDIPTVADILRDAGYEVAFFGKAHIKALSQRHWDYYFGIEAAGADYYHPLIIESAKGTSHPPERYDGYVDDVLTDRALAWLQGEHTKPFCLFLWFIAPHAPFYRPRRYLDLYDGVYIPKPGTFDDDLKGYPGKPSGFKEANNKIGTSIMGSDDPRSLEETVKNHYAGVVTNDDCARRVLETLEHLGKMDDTAIVLSSDHGFFLGEWRLYNKMFMHEPSIRVPLAIRYPRRIKPGAVSSEMVLDLDLAPTILQLAGLKPPDWMQGRSLLPLVEGVPQPRWRQDWLYEYYDDRFAPKMRGIRTGQYKLIEYWNSRQEFELYDLKADPGELRNLYGDPQFGRLTRQLADRMRQLRVETGDVLEVKT